MIAHIGGVHIEMGDFDDDARIAAWADCTGDTGKSSCRSKQEPGIGVTLDEIRAGYREFKTKQNREGDTQLKNWYKWDRILDKDQFWVEILG